MAIPPDILRIASMLDDEDENVGVNLLAQLMERADELGDLPAVLQESRDPVVRRRAHQLQSALTMRRRRQSLCARLRSDKPDLLAGLEELHLLWYDRDSAAEIHSLVREFVSDFRAAAPETPEELDFFLRRCSFLPEPESTLVPESYCIGTVLERRAGATSLLLAMAVELAPKAGWKLVRTLDEFALTDGRGQLLLGNGAWRLVAVPANLQGEVWTATAALRYFAQTLLSCAVNTDSYRYVMSIAQAVSGDDSEHVFDCFPYPFRATGPDDETEHRGEK